MVTVDAGALVAFLDRVRSETERAQPELDRLDAVAGDGDHGITMVLGWRAVVEALDGTYIATPGEALRRAAAAFADVGGTAGPLWGTALLRAGRTLGDVPQAGVAELADAAAAATQALCERGRSAQGDRTVIDAMAPAAEALAAAAQRGASLSQALAEAAAAADEGAVRTAKMIPRRGRAMRAPERARGQQDAGARGAAVFWAAARC